MNERYCPQCLKKFDAAVDRCPDDQCLLVALSDRDLSGETLDDRYEVLSKLGQGGMGVVYRARQRYVQRLVALKVLRRAVVQDESALKRFMVEAKAIAALRNRHTITLHDFGVTRDGLLYYTMDLLDGRSLTKVIREDGALDWRRAIKLLLQVCESLEEAHKRGILHRDLKPDNIVVTAEEEGERVTVLDFGIARFLGDDSVERLTATGMICGTPAYLSPEQAAGKEAGPPADLYALGIILFEMVTGNPPFVDKTAVSILLKHLQEEIPSVRTLRPDRELPPELDEFLAKALSKAPEGRFQVVAEFRAGLNHLLLSGDSGALDASAPTELGPPVAAGEQSPMPAADQTASFLEGGPTGAAAPSPAPRPGVLPPARNRQPAPEPPTELVATSPVPTAAPAGRKLLVGVGTLVALLALAVGAWWLAGGFKGPDREEKRLPASQAEAAPPPTAAAQPGALPSQTPEEPKGGAADAVREPPPLPHEPPEEAAAKGPEAAPQPQPEEKRTAAAVKQDVTPQEAPPAPPPAAAPPLQIVVDSEPRGAFLSWEGGSESLGEAPVILALVPADQGRRLIARKPGFHEAYAAVDLAALAANRKLLLALEAVPPKQPEEKRPVSGKNGGKSAQGTTHKATEEKGKDFGGTKTDTQQKKDGGWGAIEIPK